MTELLKRAIEEISKLPEQEQDAYAEFMLDELASERRRAEAAQNTQRNLDQLMDEAERELDEGKTRPLSELL